MPTEHVRGLKAHGTETGHDDRGETIRSIYPAEKPSPDSPAKSGSPGYVRGPDRRQRSPGAGPKASAVLPLLLPVQALDPRFRGGDGYCIDPKSTGDNLPLGEDIAADLSDLDAEPPVC
jgi:hypothetical protein